MAHEGFVESQEEESARELAHPRAGWRASLSAGAWVVVCWCLIGLDAATANAVARVPGERPRAPAGAALIFADGFASGDPCAWSSMQPPAVWYLDADGDGFGDPGATATDCLAPAGYVAVAGDCDDGSPATYPGAAPLDSPMACMLDGDDDDFGSVTPPTGVTAGTDCDDGQAATNPSAVEVCNLIDDDCDGVVDDGFDQDGDTYTSCNGDCDDGDPATHPGAFDDPDPLFLDRNCDGIDGDVARAAFVSNSGSDVGSCTLAAPCATLAHASAVVAADPLRDQVFVQAGSYAEGGLELVDGVEIFGGYDASWIRADRSLPGHTATITGGYVAALDGFLTVRASSATAAMADLVLAGPIAGGAGHSSHVVLALQSNLTFRRVSFLQGNGSHGANGEPGASADPTAASPGAAGEDGAEFDTSCDIYRPHGGPGATNPQCPGAATTGGDGGRGGSMDTDCSGPFGGCGNCDATPGQAGAAGGGVQGTGGLGGGLCGAPPGAGSTAPASEGAGGAPAAAGGFLDGQWMWRGHAGFGGGVGTDGHGGGGGGGAGGCDMGIDDRGPGGGGGGAGGCKAPAPGLGGGGGGGSFGILAVESTLHVYDSLFVRGSGGGGGDGGSGAAGQPGGGPGPGGAGTTDTSGGGMGGPGRRGGHSGGGGGGAGGKACGILILGTVVDESGNFFQGGSAGPGGAGGPSPGIAGGTGPDGTVGDVCACANASSC